MATASPEPSGSPRKVDDAHVGCPDSPVVPATNGQAAPTSAQQPGPEPKPEVVTYEQQKTETEAMDVDTIKVSESPAPTQMPTQTLQARPSTLSQIQQNRTQTRTPEQQLKERLNGHAHLNDRSPSTPGHLPHFDWDDFEARYQEALADANANENRLLEEFDKLVKYFNVWASAASVHDNDRGVKRLQTRERYVKLSERNLQQKKQHLAEVVRAFQSALALLSQNS